MEGDRIKEAIRRIEAAADRIGAASEKLGHLSGGDPALETQHQSLRKEVAQALADLDRLIEGLDQ